MEPSQQNPPTQTTAFSRLDRWAALACHRGAAAFLAVLTVVYLISDRYWLGAAFGLWPSWFWAPGPALLAVLGFRLGRWHSTLLLLAATALFCLVFSEGLLLLRPRNQKAIAEFADVHRNSTAAPEANPSDQARPVPLRVITWNVATFPAGPAATLAELAEHRPDLCFIQEVWNGPRDIPPAALHKHFPGWTWLAQGDCGLLSRYPARRSSALHFGAGNRAPVAELALPGSRTLTCIVVHLPLYPLRLAVWEESVRRDTRDDVEDRRETMRQLEEATRARLATGELIVAGDWNIPASAASLRPLARLLPDAFRSAGHGWGNTMTNDFPVSRIDAVFVSEGFRPVSCVSRRTRNSDHRMVIADLWLEPRR